MQCLLNGDTVRPVRRWEASMLPSRACSNSGFIPSEGGSASADAFYEQLLKELEVEEEEMCKGPTVSATTTIPEEPPKETIITPLMQHVIDAHNPKAFSGRRQRTVSGGGGRAREKENQKKPTLPAIAESIRAENLGGASGRNDERKVRERKSGKDSTGRLLAVVIFQESALVLFCLSIWLPGPNLPTLSTICSSAILFKNVCQPCGVICPRLLP